MATKMQEELQLATQSSKHAHASAAQAAAELGSYQDSLRACIEERDTLAACEQQLHKDLQEQEQVLMQQVAKLTQENREISTELQQLRGTRQHMLDKLEAAKSRLGLSEAEARAFVQVWRQQSQPV